MKRQFILVLLGIISISTLYSLMNKNDNTETDKILLDTVLGSVGAGNFSYWHLGLLGSLIIELHSHTGDADLYVSDTIRPSYEPDKNNFSSTTYGLDMVAISADFPRPIGIGVFGNWAHKISVYSLEVHMDKSSSVGQHFTNTLQAAYHEVETTGVLKRNYESAPRVLVEEAKPPLLSFLYVLDMIFEMIVL